MVVKDVKDYKRCLVFSTSPAERTRGYYMHVDSDANLSTHHTPA